MTNRWIFPPRMLAALMAGLLLTSGCGGDDSGPLGPDPGSSPDDPPLPQDVPDIPKPASPTADTPMESETLTVVRPLATVFRPVVVSTFATFTVRSRACLDTFVKCCTPWVTAHSDADLWSAAIPSKTYHHGLCSGIQSSVVTVDFALPAWGQPLLVDAGAILPGASGVLLTQIGGGQSWIERQYTYATRPLASVPHIRRDRRWVRVQLSDGSFVVDLAPNTEVSFASIQTSGVSVEESRGFAETTSVTGGLTAHGVTASIEYTVTETFSVSTTVWAETTQEVTRTVRGEAGKQTVFMLWGLEEVYSFSDADGNPFTDPNHDLDLEPAVFRGTRFSLDATTFDLP